MVTQVVSSFVAGQIVSKTGTYRVSLLCLASYLTEPSDRFLCGVPDCGLRRIRRLGYWVWVTLHREVHHTEGAAGVLHASQRERS